MTMLLEELRVQPYTFANLGIGVQSTVDVTSALDRERIATDVRPASVTEQSTSETSASATVVASKPYFDRILSHRAWALIEDCPVAIELGRAMVTELIKLFPADNISSEFWVDFEEPSTRRVFVLVALSPDNDEGFAKFRDFEFGWWLQNRSRAQGKLGLAIDHR